MNRLTPLALGAFALALLGGCADTGYGYGGGGVAIGYDGFYDDYYGPFVDGYWANDGFFRYRDARGHFHRDTGRHFRHEAGNGFHEVHGHGQGGPRDPGGDHRGRPG